MNIQARLIVGIIPKPQRSPPKPRRVSQVMTERERRIRFHDCNINPKGKPSWH